MLIERLFDVSSESEISPENLYTAISWPDPPADRPYVYINMASTVDGKVVVGEIGGTAKGVGGPTDQILFRRLQQQCDAAFVGGVTLRASNVIYPPQIPRITVTRSGDVPLDNRFFTDAPDRAFVVAPKSLANEIGAAISRAAHLVSIGDTEVDLPAALRWMRSELNIRTLLCEGGPSINDQLLRAGLVDELFLTIGPKLKGGAHTPTIVTGEGFPPGISQPLELLSVYKERSELYLRFRVVGQG